ncbi:MAG TPA: L-threonylcarbamoyladenylate synthase [Pyrinomonadaceae bacterium]
MTIRPDNEETRKLAAEIISQGGLIAFRTDTFYGIGADPLNEEAVARIKSLKGREEGKPILLLVGDLLDVDPLLSERPALFEVVASAFWPGPLTIVVPSAAELPDEITAGTRSVGLRLPDDEGVRGLVSICGGRLTATSANLSGSVAARSAADVENYFPAGIDLIIDGGEVTATKPSTVLDITVEPPKLIREGAVTKEALLKVVGKLD